MFNRGEIYRRRDLHEKYGGQHQGGMSTPAAANLIFLFTGASGDQHGYRDGWNDEGIFLYTGHGQKGDMKFERANLELLNHVSNGKDVFLFSEVKSGSVRFVGQFVATGFQFREGHDTEGINRKTIVFELCPIEALTADEFPNVSDEISNFELDLAALRRRALGAAEIGSSTQQRKIDVFNRSAAIRLYALARSGGNCEACGAVAFFKTATGRPYLEVHHVTRLSDGGPDHPDRVIAICANCHRRAHYSEDAVQFGASLLKVVSEKEPLAVTKIVPE